MATNEDTGLVDASAQTPLVDQNSRLAEEVRMLKQHMTSMYRAWMTGQAPPPPPPSFLDISPNMSTSTRAPLTVPGDPSNSWPMFKTPDAQPYTPEPTLNVSNPYGCNPHLEPPVNSEKLDKTVDDEEMTRKMKSLEQSIRYLQGQEGHKSVSYKDLCMIPNVHLPSGFKTPKFDKYDGHGDPVAHLKRYCNQLRGAGGKDEMLMACFSDSLTGIASDWFADQDVTKWHIWDDMAQEFVRQFQYNIDIALDKVSMTKVQKKSTESFREFAIRWREQAARVKPPMVEGEVVDTFLQAQTEEYYQHMLPALGKPFIEVIKMGEMIEDGIKTGRIISFADMKVNAEVTQNGSGSLSDMRENDDVAMIIPKLRRGLKGPSCSYTQPQPQVYSQTPCAQPQHYFPSQDPQYSMSPLQYFACAAQPYVQPYPYQQWCAPAPQGSYPPQAYRPRTSSIFRPRSEYKKERQQRREASGKLPGLSVPVPEVDKDELVKGTQNLFAEHNLIENDNGPSNAYVQLSG
ncbi:uncharacterized protein LOC132627998 [Lycium barbarum]|uniref:uncharacterized protein LOC132627998 n=1 Tax=Lycium barbarum TaxID=112863 RepID=UPI00293EF156|nr:uncharacterized protein LOC132627998 [Lycium barbarum]XP_060199645.1 uncharacterized protein LOC132627998 [Lycium barbarum]XP_060199646.1 uncharacterized protein LOC132627998 [Lycium barbarum]